MDRKETDEKVSVIQSQKDILEGMEANLSDFALFLIFLRKIWQSILLQNSVRK